MDVVNFKLYIYIIKDISQTDFSNKWKNIYYMYSVVFCENGSNDPIVKDEKFDNLEKIESLVYNLISSK